MDGHQFSGSGGQLDFVRGAYDAKGGKSILAFHSTARKGTVSRIVPPLSMAGTDVVVEMEDDARPFDPTQPTTIDLTADLQHRKIGGLGLHFVRRAMDEMTYRRTDRHNRLRMKKRIDRGSAKRG